MTKKFFSLIVLGVLIPGFAAMAGCASTPAEMARVTGVVKYSDGSPIAGEYALIHFDPAPESQAEIRKAAHGEIKPDGSFELFTVRPRDGAFVGDYRVTVEIKNAAHDVKSLVAREFTASASTPLKATVASSGNDFEFVVSK